MSMRRWTLLWALTLAAPSLQAQAWLPDPAAVAQAIAAQPDVRAATARVDVAQAQARARAGGPHEFQVSAIVQQRTADELGANRDFNEYEFQLGRAIRLPGKAALDRRIGAHGLDAANLRLDDARHQSARLLLERWMAWLQGDAQARELAVQVSALERERAALARREQLGDAARKDLDLLDVELAQARARQLAAADGALQAQRALAIDFPELPLPARVPQLGEPGTLPETPAAWTRRIVDRSHEIGALEAEAAQADAVAARTRADRIADPSVGLRLMEDRGGAERALGVVVSMRLGGRYRAALAQEDGAKAAALHGDAMRMRRQIEREAGQAVQAAETSRRQWQAQRQALDASNAATRRVQRGWQLGELGIADWLLAERAQRQIALDEADARIAAEQARLRVLVDAHELWHDE